VGGAIAGGMNDDISMKARALLRPSYRYSERHCHPIPMDAPALVDHSNHHRYHESLDNLTPADVYFRGQPSCSNASASSDKPSSIDACFTASSPHRIKQSDEANPPLDHDHVRPK
jgi:hypothetical protein